MFFSLFSKVEPDEKESRPMKFYKKKPRVAPPAGYKGLGSLSALNKLRNFNRKSGEIELSSTADIRSMAYMVSDVSVVEWLEAL